MKMRGIKKFIRKGMNLKGAILSSQALWWGIGLLVLVAVILAMGNLVTKGSDGYSYLQSFIRGG